MGERDEATTCVRCGVTDTAVLDLDTGSACHPEWRDCVSALRYFLREQDSDLFTLRKRLTTAERALDEARREREVVASERDRALQEVAEAETECMALRHRAERAERVVEAAREWLADLWRGDLNGTVIGVCMEYEPDGQYALWEQVAPIAEAVRALDAAEGA